MGIFNGNNNQQPPAEQNAGANSQPPANTGEGKAKGFTYRCTVKCTYKGKFYREGDTIVLPEKREVPYFKFVE